MKNAKSFGFTLVELLGAVAIIATIATISVVSIKDSVAAGQRSSVQRELQGLNTALSNFKSAGGVISADANVTDALTALQTGVTLSGSTYFPLTSMPELNKEIGGFPYSLSYDSSAGFSYIPSGEDVAAVFSGAGESSGIGANGETYPFDITDPEAVSQALLDFASMSPEDQRYQDYLAAFNAAKSMDTLSADGLASLDSALLGTGLALVDGAWVQTGLPDPAPLLASYNAASNKQAYLNSLAYTEQASLFRVLPPGDQNLRMANFTALLASEFSQFVPVPEGASVTARLNAFLSALPEGEVVEALNLLQPYSVSRGLQPSVTYDVLQKLNLAGLNLTGLNTTGKALAGTNLVGATGFTAEMFNAAGTNCAGVSLVGFDLSNFDLSNKNLSGANFSDTNISLEQLNSITTPTSLKLANVQVLSGWNTNGKMLGGSNFSGSDISVAQLVAASDLANTDLSRLDLTGMSFSGKSISGINFSGCSGVTSSVLNSATGSPTNANLSGLDLNGWNTSGKDLRGVSLVGANITMSQINSAGVDLRSINLSGSTSAPRDMTGLNLSGKILYGANFSNTNITAAQLAAAELYNPWSLDDMPVNLQGTGITKAQMQEALTAIGKSAVAADHIIFD